MNEQQRNSSKTCRRRTSKASEQRLAQLLTPIRYKTSRRKAIDLAARDALLSKMNHADDWNSAQIATDPFDVAVSEFLKSNPNDLQRHAFRRRLQALKRQMAQHACAGELPTPQTKDSIIDESQVVVEARNDQ